MTQTRPHTEPERRRTVPIDSRSGFQAALRDALRLAATQGCKDLWFVDPDYADWPLGEREVVDLLTQWAASHRRLVVLARHFDEVPRRHARWVAWRRAWSHVVSCKQVHEDDARDLTALLFAERLVAVRLHSQELYRGSISHDPADWVRQREWVQMLDERGGEAFAATTLGL